ncbi:MAG: hypothetical protein IMX01_03365 [Limnochordaceae bacterium]|nr:hypothetical protein [Limnochordaceae bacterium]
MPPDEVSPTPTPVRPELFLNPLDQGSGWLPATALPGYPRLAEAAPLLSARLRTLQRRLWRHHVGWGMVTGMLLAGSLLGMAGSLLWSGWLGRAPAHFLSSRTAISWGAAILTLGMVAGAAVSWAEGVRRQRFTLRQAALLLDKAAGTGGQFVATVEVWSSQLPRRGQLQPAWAALVTTSNTALRERSGIPPIRVRLPIPYPRLLVVAGGLLLASGLLGYVLATHPAKETAQVEQPIHTAQSPAAARVQAAFDSLQRLAGQLEKQSGSPAAQKAAQELRAAADRLAAQGEAGFAAALEHVYRAYNDSLAQAYARPTPGGRPGQLEASASAQVDSSWLEGLGAVAQQLVALAYGVPTAGQIGDGSTPPPNDLALAPLGDSPPGPTGSRPTDTSPSSGPSAARGEASPPEPVQDHSSNTFNTMPRDRQGSSPSAGQAGTDRLQPGPEGGQVSRENPRGSQDGVPPARAPGVGGPAGGGSPVPVGNGEPGMPGGSQAGVGDDPDRLGAPGSLAGGGGPWSWLPGQPGSGLLWSASGLQLPTAVPGGEPGPLPHVQAPEQAVAISELPLAYQEWIRRYFSGG